MSESSIFRVTGDPLVPATGSGPLDGQTVAVKDLYAVAGHAIGAGSPAWLAQAQPQKSHAPAVQALLDAGAEVVGIAATDEFAYSLSGTNAHYGTPPNPAAPERIPGGSSSGSATAVSLGRASIGLATDTAGSTRVPAAYQGLWGIRTTHDLIQRAHLMPLADSFDAIGWITRDPQLLAEVAEVLVPVRKPVTAPPAPAALGGMGSTGAITVVPRGPVAWEPERQLGELRVVDGLLELADHEVAEAVQGGITAFEELNGAPATRIAAVAQEKLTHWQQVFKLIQGREAWTNHGAWVSQHWDDMAPDVAARFRTASEFTAAEEVEARKAAAAIRETVRGWVGDGVLAQPSVATLPPLVDEAAPGSEASEAARFRTLLLTSLAGLAGLPVVNVPLTTAQGVPTGLSLVGPAGSDKTLIAYAARYAAQDAPAQGGAA
ncbi:amidase family protein [Nesterenkonia flava]|uniref:Amidase family protein n=1 Tax=Nesterenkonia flava TaxID=469799 RepID=A0ABU1FV38_9MICC|nr:amidase family protein [Nesterenkonia flava]MDR5712524.1 amidase family protein [Nesterenkonia flava]